MWTMERMYQEDATYTFQQIPPGSDSSASGTATISTPQSPGRPVEKSSRVFHDRSRSPFRHMSSRRHIVTCVDCPLYWTASREYRAGYKTWLEAFTHCLRNRLRYRDHAGRHRYCDYHSP